MRFTDAPIAYGETDPPMIDPGAILSWQALRAAATYEVLNPAGPIVIAPPLRHQFNHWHLTGRDGQRWIVGPSESITPEPGAILFARDAWRSPWRTQLATLPHPYVLVTAFNDATIKATATAELLSTPTVTKWYGVQTDTRHQRLVQMPVGIDARMVPILRKATQRPWAERDIRVLVNFQTNRRGRDEAMHFWANHPSATVIAFDPERPDVYADALGRSQFVVSPPGHAWDCYRTYEALAMGARPIVLSRPPISDVTVGLPVMRVDRWDDATPSRLAAEARVGWVRTHSLEPITTAYWLTRIRQAAMACHGLAVA